MCLINYSLSSGGFRRGTQIHVGFLWETQSSGNLLPIQLLADTDSCVQDEQLIFSVAGGRRVLGACTSVCQGFAGRIPDSGPLPSYSWFFFSPCRRKEELSHSAPWELRPWIQQLIFVCSAVWPTLCPSPFPGCRVKQKSKEFFFFPAALAWQWRMSNYPRDKCFSAATPPQEVCSWFRLALSSRI